MQFSRRRVVLAALSSASAAAALPAGADDKLVVLTVSGRGVANGGKVDFTMAALERLPQRSFTTPTPWYPQPRTFGGPLMRDVLAAAGAAGGERARLVALNDYRVDLPLADTREHDVVLARLLDGKPMSVREKGPLFVIYPFDSKPALRTTTYYSRCVWQLRSIELA